MSVATDIKALRAELEEIRRRLYRLELFAGDVSRDAWSRAKRDADFGRETAVVGPNLPALPVRTEINGIGA